MNKLSAQVQQQTSDLQALLNEETQKARNLQLELDAKESEIEYLKQKMALNGSGDTSSIHSGNEQELDDTPIGLIFDCIIEIIQALLICRSVGLSHMGS